MKTLHRPWHSTAKKYHRPRRGGRGGSSSTTKFAVSAELGGETLRSDLGSGLDSIPPGVLEGWGGHF